LLQAYLQVRVADKNHLDRHVERNVMMSNTIRLREMDLAIEEIRNCMRLCSSRQVDKNRTYELRLKRMVLHREVLAANPSLAKVIPEALRSRLFPT
jgi:DNA-binding transcriptional MerR regulator